MIANFNFYMLAKSMASTFPGCLGDHVWPWTMPWSSEKRAPPSWPAETPYCLSTNMPNHTAEVSEKLVWTTGLELTCRKVFRTSARRELCFCFDGETSWLRRAEDVTKLQMVSVISLGPLGCLFGVKPIHLGLCPCGSHAPLTAHIETALFFLPDQPFLENTHPQRCSSVFFPDALL